MNFRTGRAGQTGLMLCCAGAIAIAMTLDSRSDAASRLTEDFGDLVKRSALVVEVQIGASRQEANAIVGMPLTVASAKVLKVHRGELQADAQIELERFGGQSGQAQIIVPGQANFVEGTRAFVLLTASPLNNGRWRVLGGDAGYVLREQKNVARRATGRFDYFVSDEKSQSGFVAKQAQALEDREFSALVGALIETGRPVIQAIAHETTKPAAPAIPVVAMTAAMPEGENNSVPFAFRIGVVLAVITLAWGAQRLAKTLSR